MIFSIVRGLSKLKAKPCSLKVDVDRRNVDSFGCFPIMRGILGKEQGIPRTVSIFRVFLRAIPSRDKGTDKLKSAVGAI